MHPKAMSEVSTPIPCSLPYFFVYWGNKARQKLFVVGLVKGRRFGALVAREGLHSH